MENKLKIGRFNRLKVVKTVDFGVYLDGGKGREILLPQRFVPEGTQPGDEVDVFIYTDSEDRLIATTDVPYAQVGDFAYLQVSQVNAAGAFLDWGILGKDLLVPFSQQRSRMRQGGVYLVYVYLDDASGRVVASAKTERFLGNTFPEYKEGDEVECLVTGETPIGYSVIVDNLHRGMIYTNETFRQLEEQETVRAHVHRVRPDGKIDLRIGGAARERVGGLAESILTTLKANGGRMALTDKSSPEEIKAMFRCSKKDFKKAVGALYKAHRIELHPGEIVLV
ncbi:MAG: GntR family transcriptional regulator [Muribaculaceae bacterium]|nr:GntR family transcriptional regulator [Muribaculaceae bacterium]